MRTAVSVHAASFTCLIRQGNQGVHNDLNVFGLDLLAAALSAGKSAFAQHEMVMQLIREDLSRWQLSALIVCHRSFNTGALSSTCLLVRSSWFCQVAAGTDEEQLVMYQSCFIIHLLADEIHVPCKARGSITYHSTFAIDASSFTCLLLRIHDPAR